MMKTTHNKIILIRHAESEKNLKNIHGGKGEALTSLGIEQAKEAAKHILSFISDDCIKLFASTSFHTRETARIMASEMCINVEQPLEFSPLYLGVADGLSESRLSAEYPEVQESFIKWRRREIDIKQLIVPNMENYMDFWERGKKLIDALPTECNCIMVCSRSLMILLSHIMLGNHPQLTDNYRHISIQNCGIVAFDTFNKSEFTCDTKLTNVNFLR